MCNYRWIREEIQIDFPLPKDMLWLIQEMEEMDKNEDFAYFNYFDSLDVSAKELTRLGKLSQKQWNLLYKKYCGG